MPCHDNHLIGNIYETCQIAHVLRCVTIDKGRVYRCPQSMIYCERENNYDDAIEICTIENTQQLLDFLDRKIPLISCEKCLGSVGRILKHSQVKRSEWVDKLPRRPECAIDNDFLKKLMTEVSAWNGCFRRRELGEIGQ